MNYKGPKILRSPITYDLINKDSYNNCDLNLKYIPISTFRVTIGILRVRLTKNSAPVTRHHRLLFFLIPLIRSRPQNARIAIPNRCQD